jgi:hypothetical protein
MAQLVEICGSCIGHTNAFADFCWQDCMLLRQSMMLNKLYCGHLNNLSLRTAVSFLLRPNATVGSRLANLSIMIENPQELGIGSELVD